MVGECGLVLKIFLAVHAKEGDPRGPSKLTPSAELVHLYNQILKF
jgi:hypothetical protein